MAKNLGRGKKSSTSSLSPSAKNTPKKATGKRKKISYKQEYVKLLEKTNKALLKDVKAIRKAIEIPKETKKVFPETYEAFPKDELRVSPIKPTPKVRSGSVQEEILNQLNEISRQIRAREVMFDELVNSPGKLTMGEDFFND